MALMGSTIGIDPSVVAPAFAVWPSAETWQEQTKGDGSQRLSDLFSLASDWTVHHAPPDLDAVFIERPVGRFPKRALDHACGVLQVAIFDTLREMFPHPVSVFELSPGEWKRRVLGNGAAKKDEVYEWAFHRSVEAVPTQDEADALCIAAAGHQALSEQVAA